MDDRYTKTNPQLQQAYTCVHHKSGLDVYVLPKEGASTYAVFATRYGSVDRDFVTADGQTVRVPDGVAHFLEHKMFEQEDGTDAFVRFSETGADANAYTTFDHTAYLFTCTDHFAESLAHLLQFVTHPYFTDANVAKEQGIIGEEIRMGEDNPNDRVFYALMENLYAEHTIRIPVAGTVESIAPITPQILYQIYHTFYNLHNMVLCVCGNVTTEEVLRVCDEQLQPQPPCPVKRLYAEESPVVFCKRSKKQMQVARPLFSIGWKLPPLPQDQKACLLAQCAQAVLEGVLFGECGDLYQHLYETGKLSQMLSVESKQAQTYAFCVVSGEADDPEEIYDAVTDAIRKMKAQGMDPTLFEAVKRSLYASQVRMLDSVENLGNQFVESLMDGTDLFDVLDALAQLTYADVMTALEPYCDEKRMAMSVIEPLPTEKDHRI